QIECQSIQTRSEGSSYQIITIDRGQVGVTTRQLLHGKAVIDELTIPDTKFVGRAPQGYESR
ncbi:3',5'-cyclic-nucleotide phosphodiesterase, partial [Lactiplantibacillus plantarum]